MKSKAHISSHPLHPILVAFPIAFFSGTLLAHAAGWLLQKSGLLDTAYYLNLAGIIFVVLAAIPGIIDLVYTVPPASSAKKRGVKHGLTNTLMLVLFIIAFFYRRGSYDHLVLLLIEIAGVILLSIAGWMGGTLVYRNQIGVDQRYANAGKWQEAYFDNSEGSIQVAMENELKVNAMKLLHFPGKRIVLARTDDRYVAFEDRCPHKGGSLAGGSMMCNTVQCPWHGSQFSVLTGEVSAGPAVEGIKTFIVEENNGKIFLRLM